MATLSKDMLDTLIAYHSCFALASFFVHAFLYYLLQDRHDPASSPSNGQTADQSKRTPVSYLTQSLEGAGVSVTDVEKDRNEKS